MPIETQQHAVSVGLGMLSWRAAATVQHTLGGYQQAGLFDLFDDALVYFQQVSDADRAAAEAAGIRWAGNDANTGIYAGVKALLEQLRTDYVLFVENDCVLIESRDETARQLHAAVGDLAAGRADVYRMRHRFEPGYKFDRMKKYQRYYAVSEPVRDGATASPVLRLMVSGRRLLRPLKARRLVGSAVYVEQRPERRHPDVFEPTGHGSYIVSSKHLNWTNQAILFNRRWMLETILPYVAANPSGRTVNGFPDIEKELNCRWWRKQNFRIGVGRGLFTHRRLDR